MRIISGRARGKTIAAPAGTKTRPTTERVREAIFSALGPALPGAAVLDAFGGSGALGLEAISRGAKSAVFCDMDRQALNIIRKNIAACKFEAEAKVYAGDTVKTIARLGGFDVVLLDPPYNRGFVAAVEPILLRQGFLNEGAIVMLETAAKEPEIFADERWQILRQKTYGDTAVYYFALDNPDDDNNKNSNIE